MSYQKAPTLLHTLTGIVGEETMNNVFREYYRKWAFRHPSGRDFINVVSEVVKKDHGEKFGPDMNWFFDQVLYGTGICDYKVSRITNRKYRKPEGRFIGTDTTGLGRPDADSLVFSTAEIERVGEIMLPVEVLVHFSNGEEILEHWDGKERFRDFKYSGYDRIEWVKIDPEFKIKMDVNYINNSMTSEPDRAPLHRILNKILAFIQFYLSIMLL
jgi:aminopeptidase N